MDGCIVRYLLTVSCYCTQGNVGTDLLAGMLAAVDDESNERMTDEQLMDESVTFLLAGEVPSFSLFFAKIVN